GELEFARGNVIERDISGNIVERPLRRNVADSLRDNNREFGFPVHRRHAIRPHDRVMRPDHGARGLEEDAGSGRRNRQISLRYVVAIIAPDANDLSWLRYRRAEP